jgi:hypothetical protein
MKKAGISWYLVGLCQGGKTTLARSFVDADSANYFDLEDAVVAARFRASKELLSALTGLVIIDKESLPGRVAVVDVRMQPKAPKLLEDIPDAAAVAKVGGPDLAQ